MSTSDKAKGSAAAAPLKSGKGMSGSTGSDQGEPKYGSGGGANTGKPAPVKGGGAKPAKKPGKH